MSRIPPPSRWESSAAVSRRSNSTSSNSGRAKAPGTSKHWAARGRIRPLRKHSRRFVTGIAADSHGRQQHPCSPHLINCKIVKGGADPSAGMIRMDGIQANLSNPFFSIEGERHETDDVAVDQGNIDVLSR